MDVENTRKALTFAQLIKWAKQMPAEEEVQIRLIIKEPEGEGLTSLSDKFPVVDVGHSALFGTGPTLIASPDESDMRMLRPLYGASDAEELEFIADKVMEYMEGLPKKSEGVDQ